MVIVGIAFVQEIRYARLHREEGRPQRKQLMARYGSGSGPWMKRLGKAKERNEEKRSEVSGIVGRGEPALGGPAE